MKQSSKCPYGIKDCTVDTACDNCGGIKKCEVCNKKVLMPKSRLICFDCWQKSVVSFSDEDNEIVEIIK